MSSRRFLKLLFAMLLLSGLAGEAAATAAGRANAAQLPRPSGHLAIGRVDFHWIDASRVEVATEDPNDKRELVVRLFYPAQDTQAARPADYFPDIDRVEAYEERFGAGFFKSQYGEAYPLLRTIKTHTFDHPPALKQAGGFPIVLFSHGGGVPATFYTALIEDLVSHGYVVAAIEHSYDGATIVLPDGRVISQVGWSDDATRTAAQRAAFHMSRYLTGAADQSFVLDRLMRVNRGAIERGSGLRGVMDLRRVAAIGHSFGGKVSLLACRDDPRISFCLNLDGGLEAGLSYGSIKQPVAAMYGWRKPMRRPGETESPFNNRSSSMAATVQRWKEEFTSTSFDSRLLLIDVPGFSHFSYYDLMTPDTDPPPWHATPEQWERNHRLIAETVLACLNITLGRSKRSLAELTDLPSANLADVRVEAIGSWTAGSSWRFGPGPGRLPKPPKL